MGLGNKDNNVERCSSVMYCCYKLSESLIHRESLVHGAVADSAMNNWFSTLMAAWLISCSAWHNSPLFTQGNWSHSARMFPSCQANLHWLPWITWGGADKSYVTCCVTLAHDNLRLSRLGSSAADWTWTSARTVNISDKLTHWISWSTYAQSAL